MTTSRCLKNQKGFSLIEVIVSILLVGMIAVFAGMGITALMDAFMLTKMNAETTQKGQVAMTRMVKEFMVMNAVTAATATSITFISYKQGVTSPHTLS
ncbi:MAG: prepilin-type N-terminal cleavage/methylation domain-containing protein [Deltaproteobacteria bacterium]|nr:prepilin-type N-terminal cleavage/methylation domain-containing protein [Deltaproteobacteria bacterium]